MPTYHDSPIQGQACVECWEAMVRSGQSGEPLPADAASHLESCPSCRESFEGAFRLGQAQAAFAARIDDSAGSAGEMADQIQKVLRYDAIMSWARRVCAAGVAAAACLALFWSTASTVRSERLANAPIDQLCLATRASTSQAPPVTILDAQGSPAEATIPVQGWITLPPREVSADSSLWWVVLSYGGRQNQ